MSEQQFKIFWATLQESEADYKPLKKELKAAFLKATENSNEKISITKKSSGKTHKKSGYNLFHRVSHK